MSSARDGHDTALRDLADGRTLRGAIRVGDAVLPERSHLCAFYASTEEEYAILLPFIQEGLTRGEKAFHTLDPAGAGEHFRRLAEAGIDVEHCLRTQQLEHKTWDEVHLLNGRFEPEATTAVFADVIERAQRQGYRNIRFVGHMGWIPQHQDVVDELLLYEARWNEAQPQMPPSQVVCMYDLRKFRADLVIDVMRTHPQVILGKTVYENPFYVPPGEFIREIEHRTRGRSLE